MKPQFATLLFLCLSCFIFGQKVDQVSAIKMNRKITKAGKPIFKKDNLIKAGGDTLYFYDMSDQTGWSTGVIGTTTNQWNFGAITSNMNLYMGDLSQPSYGTSGDPIIYIDGITFLITSNYQESNAFIESPVLDFTGKNLVQLQWMQIYKGYNADSCFLELSVDGGISWPDSLSIILFDYIAGTDYAAIKQVFDISQYVGGKANVKIRFRWFGPELVSGQGNYGGGYGWQIDDVLITEAVENDLLFNFFFSGLYYKNIPNFVECDINNDNNYEILPMPAIFNSYRTSIFNNGISDSYNVYLNVKVEKEDQSEIYYNSSSDSTIDLLSSFDNGYLHEYMSMPFSFNNWASGDTLLDAGNYQIVLNTLSDSIDEVPANNESKYKFSISDNYFAVDNGDVTGFESIPISSNPTNGDIYGVNYYNALNKAHVKSLKVFITNQSGYGITLRAQLYKRIDHDVYDLILESDEYFIGNGNIGDWLELPFNTNGTLEYLSDNYYLAAIKVVDYNNEDFYIGNDISEYLSNCYTVWYDQTFSFWRPNYYDDEHPAIRLVFDNGTAIDEEKLVEKIVIYPNPTKGKLFISNPEKADIYIYNVMGKLVYCEYAVSENLNISNLSAGTYILKITKEDLVLNKKIILLD